MSRRLITIFLAAAVCGMLSGCVKEKPPLMRIGTNIWPGYEPIYLAQELKYFKDDVVRPTEFPSATEEMVSFRNNAIDAAALTFDEALSLAQFDADFSIVLILDVSHGADVLLGKPSMKQLRDIKGKRIGVETTAVGAYMLARALQKAGVKQDEVKIVNLDRNEHEQAFRQGAVDAVVTFEPTRTKLMKAGARILFDSSQIPNEILDVMIVRREFLKKHPDVVANFVRGWFRALTYMEEQPNEAAEMMRGRLKLSASEVLAAYRGLNLPHREDNLRLLSGEQPKLLEPAKKVQDVMLEHRLLLKRVDTSRLIDRDMIGRLYEQ